MLRVSRRVSGATSNPANISEQYHASAGKS